MNFTHQDITSTVLSPKRHFSKGVQTYYANQAVQDGFVALQLLFARYIINRRAATESALVLANHGFDNFEVDARYSVDLLAAWTPAQMERVAEPMRYEPQIVQFMPSAAPAFRRNNFYQAANRGRWSH
jgi:hypothetical protein